jgi:ribose transport system substrate-binding protein
MRPRPGRPRGISRLWPTVLVAALLVGGTQAISLAQSPGAVAPECNIPYDASILDPRPMPDSLNPESAKPPIEEMSVTSADLGSLPDSPPAWYDTLTVTPEQVQQICSLHLKAVFLDWADALYNQIIRSGQRLTLQAMGIDLIRVTSFSFDPNGLAGNLASVLPLEPDIIFTGGTIDPNQMAQIMQPALDQGITIITWAVGANGWETGPGKQITSMIAYDFYQLGQQMADAVCARYPDGANLGYVHWIQNIDAILLREQGFLDGLQDCTAITVIADGGPPDPRSPNSGFNDPNAATAFTEAFIQRHPEVNVLFAPWEDPPGLGIEAAIKSQGKEGQIDIVTMDLGLVGAPQLASDGTITVDMAQDIFDGGRSMALAAGLNAIGVEVPPFIIFPTFAATSDNLCDAWTFMHGPEFPCPVVPQ